jgi:hypothetical protein
LGGADSTVAYAEQLLDLFVDFYGDRSACHSINPRSILENGRIIRRQKR